MNIYIITESQRGELMRSLASRYPPTDWLAKLRPCAEIEALEDAALSPLPATFLPPALYEGVTEHAPGDFTLKFSGLTMRQIKEIVEDKYHGSLMWSNGAAYPQEGVSVKFVNNAPTAPVHDIEKDIRICEGLDLPTMPGVDHEGADSVIAPVGFTSIDEMCAILDRRHFEVDEYTDCALIYKATFDQLRGLYDEGRAQATTHPLTPEQIAKVLGASRT